MIQIGDIQIQFLTDGTMYVDAGGPFGLVPRSLYRKYLEPNADNQIPMSLHCLLVRANGKKIIIDTGLGSKLTDQMKKVWGLQRPTDDLVSGLARAGLQPGDIDVVINTHLHGDHCSGNTSFNADMSGVTATFPNAYYVTQRREYEDAMQPNERTRATYYPINYQPLVESGQMRLLDGDTEILPGIFGVITRGHTPAHMSIRFESQGQHGLFLADLASYAVHFEKLAWMTSYDVEPLYTLETKRIWQKWALETGATLLFQHDPHLRAGRYGKDGEKLAVIPIDEPVI